MGIMRIMGKMRDRRRFVMKDCSGSAKFGAGAAKFGADFGLLNLPGAFPA
jgi:hypothetical protein